MTDIRVSAPRVREDEIDAVVDVLRSGMLAAGPMVAAFEAAVAEVAGARHAVAVSSGTAAIHCAMQAHGLSPGQEVIATPFTFVGTVNPALMQGAKLRFVDIDLADFGPDTAALGAAVGSQTGAVVVVDLYGQPVDVAAVTSAVGHHGVPIIEDACQAIGASYDGKPAGNLFDSGCYSFYATKNVMCGEGGVLVTDDDEVATSARRFRQHGMSGPYEYSGLGYNYRMTDVLAAVAVRQVAHLAEVTARRETNAQILSAGLSEVPGLVLPTTLPNRSHAWHQYVVRITDGFGQDRDTVQKRLAERGVHAAVYYPKSLTEYPHVAAATVGDTEFPNAERAAREVLALPIHPDLTASDMTQVVDAVVAVASG